MPILALPPLRSPHALKHTDRQRIATLLVKQRVGLVYKVPVSLSTVSDLISTLGMGLVGFGERVNSKFSSLMEVYKVLIRLDSSGSFTYFPTENKAACLMERGRRCVEL